jgi:hypothetical protein
MMSSKLYNGAYPGVPANDIQHNVLDEVLGSLDTLRQHRQLFRSWASKVLMPDMIAASEALQRAVTNQLTTPIIDSIAYHYPGFTPKLQVVSVTLRRRTSLSRDTEQTDLEVNVLITNRNQLPAQYAATFAKVIAPHDEYGFVYQRVTESE